jgi:hypothetical protein
MNQHKLERNNINTLQERIQDEINELPVNLQKEVFDFILFIKNKINTESDNDFLSKNADAKQAIIEGLNTPLEQCSEYLDW